jgi:hypothetical protein
LTLSRRLLKLIVMSRVAVALALQLMAAGCQHTAASVPEVDAGATNPGDPSDRDHDGLCDDSEAQFGTNPDAIDTDHDGWPDVIEVIADTDPHDPSSPSLDQVGYLMLDPGTLDFRVATTADGNGEGATGQLVARNALDRHNRRANEYYQGVTATTAEPPDNVRGVQSTTGHFASIVGSTRLQFHLQFGFTHDETLTCAVAMPFDFAIKSDVGGFLASQRYVLVVTDKPPRLMPRDFCLPVGCL